MKRLFFVILAGLALIIPQKTHAYTFDPNNIIADSVFIDRYGLSLDGVKSFLTKSFLGSYSAPDYQGELKSAANIIYESSQRYGINPKVLLVLVQKEQSLITDDSPTTKQLDWATGYGVCDSCSMSDPRLTRWQGFGKQVNSAAAQFIDGYMADIQAKGAAYGKYGPGIPLDLGAQTVTPANAATAALYAYTPHIHGNQLFGSLWNQWFASNFPDGALIKSAEKPEIYFIKDGTKRHIGSYSVLVSRFDEKNISVVPQSTVDDLPSGPDINYPNYSLLLINGGRYLVNGDTLLPFQSEDVFHQFGFQDEELIKTSASDISSYTVGDTITKYTTYPTGKLVQIIGSGSYFYLENGTRFFVSPDLLKLQFRRYPVYKVKPESLSDLRDGGVQKVANGYLLKSADSPVVYLISANTKRPVSSIDAFKAYGWTEKQIVTVGNDLLDLITLGDSVTAPVN